MRKLWINLAILAVLVLSACSQATPVEQTSQPKPTTVAVATEDPSAVKMECQLVSMSPTQEPTLRSAFPPVSDEDWLLGVEANPSLTVIEYSDFQ